MVKSRNNADGERFKTYIDSVHDKFAKQMTHRLVTETTDAEGRVTARSTTDATFYGDLQYGTQVDDSLIEAGWVERGEGLLYVSADETQASLFVTDNSIIIEGVTANTYDAWVVIEKVQTDQVVGVNISYIFKVKRRTQQVIS